MKLGIDNHTRWKHKWWRGGEEGGWHNWGKSGARKGCERLEDRKDFATFALDDNVTQSVAHRPKIGEEIKENEMKNEPIKLRQLDSRISIRPKGATA